MERQIVVTRASEVDFRRDYVALPKEYGSKAYFERADVKAIFQAVFENLDRLNEKTGVAGKLAACRRVFVKPNLVSVYHRSGLRDEDYPETTDPRVFDAVIAWIKQFQQRIVIVESSGKPIPTRESFRLAGYDRIARYRGTGIKALETCPVIRYMLPKAEVMREVYIPEMFREIVDDESCFVSVPKLKTNLYTGVTLGIKNAMGAIPYALRERNHSYYINKKLADLLYLIRPDITVIDGIVGGEGNTPAPVDPVDTRVIVSGTDPVGTDEAATRIMGIDPARIPLLVEARRRGFGHDDTPLDGELPVFAFRRANPSMMDEDFHRACPNVLVLAGHCLPHAPQVDDIHAVTPALARDLELACDGGCLNSLRSGFEFVAYAPKKNMLRPLVVVIGGGVASGGGRYWFDRDGNPYEEADIRAMRDPILTVGNCASRLSDAAAYQTPGCCSPSVCMQAVTNAMRIPFPLMSFKNRSVLSTSCSAVRMILARCALCLRGRWIDCPSEHEDKLYPIPALSPSQQALDYAPWPLPAMTWATRRRLFGDQLRMLGIILKLKHWRVFGLFGLRRQRRAGRQAMRQNGAKSC